MMAVPEAGGEVASTTSSSEQGRRRRSDELHKEEAGRQAARRNKNKQVSHGLETIFSCSGRSGGRVDERRGVPVAERPAVCDAAVVVAFVAC